MREQRHRNTFNGHHEASCERYDGRRARRCFDLWFALVIDPAENVRDDVVREVPIMAHRTAFGTIFVIPSRIPRKVLSRGGFTRSVSMDHHPGWRSLL
jgi:hypothetical protein